MSAKAEMNTAEMKAERKRLATARGLLTRERNKLAREREELGALAADVERAQAQEREQLDAAREALRAQDAEVVQLRARLQVAETKYHNAEAELALVRMALKAAKKEARKATPKKVRKLAGKKAKKLARKLARKKLAKARNKIQRLEHALNAAQGSARQPAKPIPGRGSAEDA